MSTDNKNITSYADVLFCKDKRIYSAHTFT